MRHSSRLIVGGGAGTPTPAASSFSLTSHTLYQGAKGTGRLGGMQRLRGLDRAGSGGQGGAGEGDAGAALILSYTSSFPLAWNQKGSWSGTTYVEEISNPFGDQKHGLIYEPTLRPERMRSAFSLAANQGVRLRLDFFDVPTPAPGQPAAPPDVFHARVGSGAQRWQLTRRGGGWELARLTGTWSEAGQAQLEALLDLDEPTQANLDQIDALRGPRRVEEGGTVAFPNALYDIVESVSLNSGKGTVGKYFDITLLPEPEGRLNVRSGVGEWQSVEVPDVLAKPPGSTSNSTIVAAGTIEVQTRAGAFIWQVGRPVFALKNTLSIGPSFYSASYLHLLLTIVRADAATVNAAAQTGSTLAGTAASATWRDATTGDQSTPDDPDGVDVARAIYFDLILETSDNRFTPFLYGAQVDLHGGLRTLNLSGAFDSDDHRDAAGHSPILDASFGQDGEMKRQKWTITLRDPKGLLLAALPGARLSALENRVASLTIGPSRTLQLPALTRGLIQSATLDDLANLNPALARALNAHGATGIQLSLADAWALLDERKFKSRPIGDGQYLGAHLRRLLLDEGFSAADIAGISATAGRILPRARLGETDCIVPARNQSVGEYLRQLVERWGMGWELFQNRNGVWTFAAPSTTIATVGVWNSAGAEALHQAAFSSDPARNNSESFPGRFAMLSKIAGERDFSDFHNIIEVEGGVDPSTGLPFYDRWTMFESVEDEDSPYWLGREKVFSVCDSAVRSANDLNWMLRSLSARYWRGGRMTTFETYFHAWAQIGQIITADDVPHRIMRIPSASSAQDTMQLAAMEL